MDPGAEIEAIQPQLKKLIEAYFEACQKPLDDVKEVPSNYEPPPTMLIPAFSQKCFVI